MAKRAVSLVLVVLSAACAREPKRAVLGEWASAGERMEFLEDARVLLKHTDGSVTIASWEFPEKRVMRLASSPPPRPTTRFR